MEISALAVNHSPYSAEQLSRFNMLNLAMGEKTPSVIYFSLDVTKYCF